MNKLFKIIQSIVLAITFVIASTVVVSYADENKLSPFKEHVLPCEVNACDFDFGGAGVAYNVVGTINGKYVYRDDAQMNFYTSNGVVVGYNAGEWMKYTITVSETAIYKVSACYATPNDCNFSLLCDDVAILTSTFKSTSGWSAYKTYGIGKVQLTKGTHVLTYKLLSSGCTFKSLTFDIYEEKSDENHARKTGPFRTFYLPTQMEAEDFDLTGNATHGDNDDELYRLDEGIKIQEGATGRYISLSKNQSVDYTVNVEQSSPYTMYLTGNGTVTIQFDDEDNDSSYELTGLNEEAELVSLYFEKGIHKVTLSTTSNLSVDYIRFKHCEGKYYTLSELAEKKKQANLPAPTYKDVYVDASEITNGDGSKESPFNNINAAKDYVSTISDDMQGEIVVHLAKGDYALTDELSFTTVDSGKNGYNIIYRGETGATINGGTKITNWQKQDNGIWVANCGVITDMRTMYVNGLPARRARSKYLYYPEEYADDPDTTYGEDGIVISRKNFPISMTNPEDVELEWNLYWTNQHTPVKNIDYNEDTITFWMDQPWFHYARTKSYDGTNPSIDKTFYIVNAMEFLDEPGEFYFNKKTKKVYYYPFLEENMSSAEVYAGTTEFLASIKGNTVKDKVQNIIFDNISFKYGAWNGASTEGVVCSQADHDYVGANESVSLGGKPIPGQITLEYAKNIQFKNCNFADLGSAGIVMYNSVSNTKVIGNRFTDISGSAIVIGSWNHTNTIPDGEERVNNISVENNVIRRAAEEFMGGCGISTYYVNTVSLLHNDIKSVPYSGITTGWGWGLDVVDCANNTISYNRIDTVNNPVHDGAQIYNLGPQRNSYITNNYLTKTGDYRGGIYCDQGSGYLTIDNNVVDIKDGKNWLFASNPAIKSISVNNNYTTSATESIDTANVTVKNTNVVADKNWNDTAKRIIDEAGVQDEYKTLLKGVEYPIWRTNPIYTVPQSVFAGTSSDGTIEAEDYIDGGEGVGYHKIAEKDLHRYTTVSGKPGNLVIGTTMPTEWLKYAFNVEQSGMYTLQLKVANAFSASDPVPMANIYLDDEQIVDGFEIPNNGSWNMHEWVDVLSLNVPEGEHTLKVEFVNNGFSFDAWKLYNPLFKANVINDDNYDDGIIVDAVNDENYTWLYNTLNDFDALDEIDILKEIIKK